MIRFAMQHSCPGLKEELLDTKHKERNKGLFLLTSRTLYAFLFKQKVSKLKIVEEISFSYASIIRNVLNNRYELLDQEKFETNMIQLFLPLKGHI